MLSDTIIKYCSLFLYNADKNNIKICLESSPLYPSLLSVIKTLQFVNLDSKVGQCDWDYLKKMESPFLLHIILNFQETLVICKWDNVLNSLKVLNPKNNKWETKDKKNIQNKWDGIVIYTNNQTKRYRYLKDFFIMLIVAVVIAISLTVMRQCGIPFISGMPIIIGFMASLCIHRRKLLPRNILDKICKTNSITDCNAVETSSYGTWSGLSIINMALSFFVSQLLGIFVSAILEISSILNTEYFISSIVIIPIVLYSIYGQIKVGKVCPLCIIILMCVLSEALIFVSLPPNSINLGLILVFGIIYIGILFLLQFYTYINITQQEQLNTMIQLLKLKRKKEIMLLESTKIEPINSPIWFGEENSSTCITTIISPGCKHCQKIIKELCLLVEKGDKFRWNVVLGKTKNQDSEEIEVWIQEYFRDKQLFLQNLKIWSNNNDKSLYSVPYSFVCDKNKSKIISDFDATIEKLKIKEIPRIIVNDRILSPIYTEKDLKYVIADMSE